MPLLVFLKINKDSVYQSKHKTFFFLAPKIWLSLTESDKVIPDKDLLIFDLTSLGKDFPNL